MSVKKKKTKFKLSDEHDKVCHDTVQFSNCMLKIGPLSYGKARKIAQPSQELFITDLQSDLL